MMRRTLIVLSMAVTIAAVVVSQRSFVHAEQPTGIGAPVVVVNPTTSPVPVRTVAAAIDLVTVQLHDFCSTEPSPTDKFTVPAGKVLVLEDMSGNLSVGAGDRRHVGLLARGPASETLFYDLPLTFVRSEGGTTDVYGGHELMRVYVRAGWTVEALVGCITSDVGGGFGVRVNGHLVNVAG